MTQACQSEDTRAAALPSCMRGSMWCVHVGSVIHHQPDGKLEVTLLSMRHSDAPYQRGTRSPRARHRLRMRQTACFPHAGRPSPQCARPAHHANVKMGEKSPSRPAPALHELPSLTRAGSQEGSTASRQQKVGCAVRLPQWEDYHGPDSSCPCEGQAGSMPGSWLAPPGQLPAVHARREDLQPLVEQLRPPLPLHTHTPCHKDPASCWHSMSSPKNRSLCQQSLMQQ